uniref:FAD-dependent monooxygenase idtM n=1 Tax=Claviceps paspali TaxID=40601 RepID=IDTM_CLAPA|nr:RecName: Full=FAD-dependent monooxygenase idtM; AltName: Full=Indole-diterpene biosynthesis cluster protein M [Claviceps paspali]AFO85424.1 FAD dependent monooxygenase [Claviceps paspali]
MADDFKVVIVGGSVAGLSLAHCLERLGVSYVVLEKGSQIAPQLGASIGILPNGGRILDQLGIFRDVEDEIEPLNFAVIRYADGFSFRSQYPKALHSSYGYPVSFLERQKFIQILYDKLRGKNHVHTRKRVVSIVDGPGKALIRTDDGDEYDADMVVGADGVHSVVRSEIWRHAKEAAGTAVTEEEPNADIKYDYACVYGISVNVPHADTGVQLSSLSDGVSIHLFAGKGSKFFWFIMVRTSRDEFLELKKDSAHMARRTCEGLGSKRLSDAVYFRDVWSRCTVYQMTPLEEGVFRQWNRGRLVCIGDAIRKMAPNIGQGANMAIEDAAQLSNLIREMLASPRKASATTVEKMLRDFAAMQKARTKSMCGQSEFLVRMHANEGFGRRLLGRYLIPSLQDAPAGLAGLSIRGAVKLECAGVPSRTLGKAWEGSWGSSLRNLMYLRPRLGILSLVYVVAGLAMMYMSIYLVVPARLAAQAFDVSRDGTEGKGGG